jgi:hypothetical protein
MQPIAVCHRVAIRLLGEQVKVVADPLAGHEGLYDKWPSRAMYERRESRCSLKVGALAVKCLERQIP